MIRNDPIVTVVNSTATEVTTTQRRLRRICQYSRRCISRGGRDSMGDLLEIGFLDHHDVAVLENRVHIELEAVAAGGSPRGGA